MWKNNSKQFNIRGMKTFYRHCMSASTSKLTDCVSEFFYSLS